MGKPAVDRRLSDAEAMAYGKRIRGSPRKLNDVARAIRGLDCEAALSALRFLRRRVAGEVRKILESAIANAENNHDLDVDRLYVSEATVGRTLVNRRWRPRARGRVGRVEKPVSNLRLIVREREEPE